MSRRRFAVLSAATLLLAMIVATAVAHALGIDQARQVMLDSSSAISVVRDFVKDPGLTADVSVSGPEQGALASFYEVSGRDLSALVDAHDGSVLGLVIGSNIGNDGKISTSAGEASDVASKFLSIHSISTMELTKTVRFLDHGDSAEYVVEWDRVVNGAIVPDARIVGVDASTGLVFRFVQSHHSYVPPKDPSISKDGAVAAALKLTGLDENPEVTSVVLRVVITTSGEQRLVWDIGLAAPTDPAATQGVMSYWLVRVDANDGAAEVMTRG